MGGGSEEGQAIEESERGRGRAAAVAVRSARVVEGKRGAAEAAATLAAAWELCNGGVCNCGVVPCPMEKFELCVYCPEPLPKPSKCKVRACVAARKAANAPLMLTGPAAVLSIK